MPENSERTEAEFVITRTFDAPREKVWQALSESKHLAHWWGPKEFELKVKSLDFTPGGIFHYEMKAPHGSMWGKFVYREITPQERIVFVNSFSDEQGNITRAPFFDGKWALEILNILTLEESENGKTFLTLRGKPINATEEEIQTFHDNFASMQQGFRGTWEKLENYLRSHNF